MPVTINDTDFDLLPPPSWGTYRKIRVAPKITFKAAKGYRHQREAFPHPKYRFPHGWKLLTTAEMNTLETWLDFIGSKAFYYVVPDTEYFFGVEPKVRLVQVVDEEVEIEPVSPGYYRASITLEDV